MPRLMSSTQMYLVIAMELPVRHLCDSVRAQSPIFFVAKRIINL